MATVYKIEIEVVCDWIDYKPKDVEAMLINRIEAQHKLLKQDFRVSEIKVKRN